MKDSKQMNYEGNPAMTKWYLNQLITIQKNLKSIEDGFVDIESEDFPGSNQVRQLIQDRKVNHEIYLCRAKKEL